MDQRLRLDEAARIPSGFLGSAAERLPMFFSFVSAAFSSLQKWVLRRYVRAFERANNYDMGYVHEILESDPNAVLVFNRIGQMARYSGPLPRDVAHSVGLIATLHEDCGPCLQLGVTFAQRAHVPDDIIARVISGEATNDPDVDLVVQFCKAVLGQQANEDALRERVVHRFGHSGLTAIAFSLTGKRMYPMIKRVLGHAQCYPVVQVGERKVRLLTHADPAVIM
jgi:hypothetical protein